MTISSIYKRMVEYNSSQNFWNKFLNESLQRLRQKLVQGNKKRALIVVLPLKKWPNTNTKIFQLPKKDRIQIWILFSFSKVTKYEHHLAYQKWPNTNIIRLPKNDRTQTQIFCSPKRTKYELEQYSVSKKGPNPCIIWIPKIRLEKITRMRIRILLCVKKVTRMWM